MSAARALLGTRIVGAFCAGACINLTDEAYRVSGNSSLTAASGYAEVVYAPPRQWFLEMSFDF